MICINDHIQNSTTATEGFPKWMKLPSGRHPSCSRDETVSPGFPAKTNELLTHSIRLTITHVCASMLMNGGGRSKPGML